MMTIRAWWNKKSAAKARTKSKKPAKGKSPTRWQTRVWLASICLGVATIIVLPLYFVAGSIQWSAKPILATLGVVTIIAVAIWTLSNATRRSSAGTWVWPALKGLAVLTLIFLVGSWVYSYATRLPGNIKLVDREWSERIHTPAGLEVIFAPLANVAFEVRLDGNDDRIFAFPRRPVGDTRSFCEWFKWNGDSSNFQLRLTEDSPTRFELTYFTYGQGPCHAKASGELEALPAKPLMLIEPYKDPVASDGVFLILNLTSRVRRGCRRSQRSRYRRWLGSHL